VTTPPIEAVVFDCYGTLLDFDDAGFERAYGRICAEQGLDVTGKAVFDSWMEVWRRAEPNPAVAAAVENEPGPLSEVDMSGAPKMSRLGGGWNRRLDGPPPPFRHYREEWPEHFELVFKSLGVVGDAGRASERLRVMLAEADAYPEVRAVIDELSRRLPVAAMSNADNDFLHPCLARNALAFPVVVTSEDVVAYKPHIAIFNAISDAIGVEHANILYVGDSRTADVIGAKHAGMQSAWVNRRGQLYHHKEGEPHPYEPDFEVADLGGLLRIIDART
jgi:2-haloalkanoic acid dehalogenase type II